MVRGIPRTVTGLAAFAALFAAHVASASATLSDPQLQGTITITGSEGRDDIQLGFDTGAIMEVTPAATVTAANGACNPDTDQVTGRPTVTRCRLTTSEAHDVVVNLGGGNDQLRAGYDASQSQGPNIRLISASGAAGNDVISIEGVTRRTFLGGDGDDQLAAPGRTTALSSTAVTWDGGNGTDSADFNGTTGLFQSGASVSQVDLHVTASLATKTAALSSPSGTVRTDTLTAIEGVSGTETGDILTGGPGPDTLIGGDGPDNLIGSDGNDSLSGGAGLDDLNGGKGADILDGGIDVDTFAKGEGGDTYLARDGYAESIACVSADTVQADLADKVFEPAKCSSVSVAQAKHRFDTTIGGRAALKGGGVQVRLSCPEQKTEACRGTVKAAPGNGGATLGSARYRIPPGKSEKVTLDTGPGARSLAGSKLKLRLSETDADQLPRKVVRRVPLKLK